MNAEFQRIARRDKKAFLSEQCKEIEENNRMGETSDLFKKMRDIKGTFHAKMGTIKDRNCMDLIEAEDINKMWQEYTEEIYKKDLNDPNNHDGMITRLEPDIMECEVKCALGSITTNKASGADEIPVELFQILKKMIINLDCILKSRDITLTTKVHLVKAIVFTVVMYGCESWTMKKAESQRIDDFKLWCWRRLLRVLCTAMRFTQYILMGITPECSLERLMLKVKLQYSGHLM